MGDQELEKKRKTLTFFFLLLFLLRLLKSCCIDMSHRQTLKVKSSTRTKPPRGLVIIITISGFCWKNLFQFYFNKITYPCRFITFHLSLIQSSPQWMAVNNRSPNWETCNEERLHPVIHCGTLCTIMSTMVARTFVAFRKIREAIHSVEDAYYI